MSESTPAAGMPADKEKPAPSRPTPPPPAPSAGPVPPPAGPPAPAHTYAGPPQEPSINSGWVIAAMILFWPTAIPAMFASQRASRALGAGNWPLAADEASRAKKYSLISIWVAVGVTVLTILIAIVVIIIAAATYDGNYWHYWHNRGSYCGAW